MYRNLSVSLIFLGNGLCCSYDAIGSFEHVKYTSSGTGNKLVQPLLDNQVGYSSSSFIIVFIHMLFLLLLAWLEESKTSWCYGKRLFTK